MIPRYSIYYTWSIVVKGIENDKFITGKVFCCTILHLHLFGNLKKHWQCGFRCLPYNNHLQGVNPCCLDTAGVPNILQNMVCSHMVDC